MPRPRPARSAAACGLAALLTVTQLFAADAPPAAKPLLMGNTAEAAKLLKPSSEQVTVSSGLNGTTEITTDITIKAGESGYPGVDLIAPDGKWDLSPFSRIEAKITNLGQKPVVVTLRVDDDGPWQSNPWNGENKSIKPGETVTAMVRFGYSFGNPGYKLKSERAKQVKLFTGKRADETVLRLHSIEAAGKAGEALPVAPQNVRVIPKDGYVVGGGNKIDPKIITTKDAKAAVSGEAIDVTFDAKKPDAVLSLKLPEGAWDLKSSTQTTFTLKNTGPSAVTPRVKMNSIGGDGQWVAGEPIAPGATGEVVVTYANPEPIDFAVKNDRKFSSNQVSAIHVGVTGDAAAERSLSVTAIQGVLVPAEMPSWLGQRPPVEGDWKKTFEDNFDGTEIDLTRWNIYTANYWDKRTRFSKDNVLVGDGVVKLRYEKKTGHHNDDPNAKTFDYTCGFLDTYGKWVQRYGYFEARFKVPTAPGLWPAFWTMPDRGADKGPQWVRASTEKGGMELDIFEHLTKWGPYRYNIAHHWDGYGKNHKANGTSHAYYQPDKDGYITAGVLWLPGEATYYANGVEVAKWKDEKIGSVESYPILYMVSGGWDNNALDDKQLPADFVIDYVRIWQRGDLASEVDGTKGDGSARPKSQD